MLAEPSQHFRDIHLYKLNFSHNLQRDVPTLPTETGSTGSGVNPTTLWITADCNDRRMLQIVRPFPFRLLNLSSRMKASATIAGLVRRWSLQRSIASACGARFVRLTVIAPIWAEGGSATRKRAGSPLVSTAFLLRIRSDVHHG